MKNQRQIIKYKYLITALFATLILILFILNVKETVGNVFDGENETTISSMVQDVESVDSVIYPFININGLYQGLMQRNYMYDVEKNDELIRKEGKYLISVSSPYDRDALKKSADKLKETATYLEGKSIPLIYVQAGSKMTLSPEESMVGIPNTSYSKVEKFLDQIKNNDIDYVDTRQWIDNGMQGFYKTDHHWTTETCLTVSQKICQYLNDNYNMNLSSRLFNKRFYDIRTYEDAFLGAEGRRSGRYYVGLDDFNVITPKYDTDFDVTIHTKEGETYSREGSYDKSIMDNSKDPAHYNFEDSAYYTYWGGDYSLVHVENKKVKDGKSALIIKDSYGIPVSAFMANAFDTVDVVDVRYYAEEESITELIERTMPDAVVYIYGSGYLEESSMFSLDDQ